MAPRHVAALLLVAALTAGACGGGGDDPEVADADRSTTTTAAEEGSAGVEAAPVEPSFTVDGAPAAVPSGGSAPPVAAAPAAPEPGSPAADAAADSIEVFRPTPGSYRYSGEFGGDKADSTIRYEGVGEERGAFRMKQTSTDEEGMGSVRELLWSGDGIRVDRQHNFSANEESGRCDWNPDLVQYLLPLEVGRRWEITTTCRSTDPTRPGTLNQKSTVRVTDRRKVTVGALATTVFVLERDSSTTVGAAGVTIVRRRRTTELWSPRYGVVVEESGTASTETPGEDRPPTAFRYKLLNLRPE